MNFYFHINDVYENIITNDLSYIELKNVTRHESICQKHAKQNVNSFRPMSIHWQVPNCSEAMKARKIEGEWGKKDTTPFRAVFPFNLTSHNAAGLFSSFLRPDSKLNPNSFSHSLFVALSSQYLFPIPIDSETPFHDSAVFHL
jgi:hypothetical protein